MSLYNAINSTNYTNPDDLQFNTIGDALYMGMKNDVSFLVASDMNLWEQQSSFNPNMPMRLFLYAAQLFEKFIQTSDYYQYFTPRKNIFSVKTSKKYWQGAAYKSALLPVCNKCCKL